jgi:hypothetical protein
MRTTRRLLIIVAVLALPLWIAGSAVGGVDCTNLKFADNPQCATTTVPDTTTTTAVAKPNYAPGLSCDDAVVFYDADFTTMQWSPSESGETLGVLLTKATCIDLLTTEAAIFTIDVIDPGAAGQLMVNLRDSHPGDWCSLTQFLDLKKAQPPLTLTLPAEDDESGFDAIPPATVNACGTGISEATLDESGEIASQTFEATSEADPLALLITYGRSGPTTVELQVTYQPVP